MFFLKHVVDTIVYYTIYTVHNRAQAGRVTRRKGVEGGRMEGVRVSPDLS